MTGHTLSLLVPGDGRATVPPQWERGAVDVPPPATLAWSAIGADGSTEDVEPVDGTGGLRRPGLLRVPWPTAWNRLGAGRCRLRATVIDGAFTEPPRLGRVVPNAVVARHLVPASADLGDQVASMLALPGQRLHLPDAAGSVDDGPGTVTLHLRETPVGPPASEVADEDDISTWRSVAGWVGVGPDDSAFVVDRERGDLVFGDGLSGRVPRPSPDHAAVARYRLGGGAAGNLGPHGRWVQEEGAFEARNPVAATGGGEAETIEEARQRAADSLAIADRTVTGDDAVRLVLETPGVAVGRADAWVGHHPGFPCVTLPGALTVVVVPVADRTGPASSWVLTPAPDRGLLTAVQAHLDAGRLVGQEVFVIGPSYRAVRVHVQLSGSADETVETKVVDALTRYLDALRGGSDGDGWPFGSTVRPSGLIGVAADAAGIEVVVVGLTVALDDGPASDCSDLPLGPADLPWLAGVVVERRAARPTGGGLS